MATRKPPTTTQPLAVLDLGLTWYVLPIDKAQKAMALLASGLRVKPDYEGGYRPVEEDRHERMSLTLIGPEQLKDAQLRIGHEPAKLPPPKRS